VPETGAETAFAMVRSRAESGIDIKIFYKKAQASNKKVMLDMGL